MATAQKASVSIKPSEFLHGGGLINDVDCTIKTARWVPWDYQGKSVSVTAACVIYETEDGEENPAYYSIGKEGSASFIPSKDGKTLDKIGSKEQLSDGCNFFQFISSVINAGFPEDQIDGSDISFLDGHKVHVKREAQPDRPGVAKQEGQRERTTLCISKFYDLGGAGAGAGKSKSATGGSKSAAGSGKVNGSADAVDSALDAKTADLVLAALGEAGGSLAKPKLSQALFKLAKGDSDSTKVITLAFKDEFLAAEGRPWVFDKASATVSLG